MAGVLSRILGVDEVRKELKARTDELKAASELWVKASAEHQKATRDLAKAIREHKLTLEKFMQQLKQAGVT